MGISHRIGHVLKCFLAFRARVPRIRGVVKCQLDHEAVACCFEAGRMLHDFSSDMLVGWEKAKVSVLTIQIWDVGARQEVRHEQYSRNLDWPCRSQMYSVSFRTFSYGPVDPSTTYLPAYLNPRHAPYVRAKPTTPPSPTTGNRPNSQGLGDDLS